MAIPFESEPLKRTPEQIAAEYQASFEAKQRILANPDLMAMLRQKLAELNERIASE